LFLATFNAHLSAPPLFEPGSTSLSTRDKTQSVATHPVVSVVSSVLDASSAPYEGVMDRAKESPLNGISILFDSFILTSIYPGGWLPSHRVSDNRPITDAARM